MDVGMDIVLVEETLENAWITCGDFLSVEPFKSLIIGILWNRQRQTALREAKTIDNLCLFVSFLIFVLAYDTYVSYTAGNTLWDVIVAKEEHLQWEVGALYEQGALAWTYFDVRFRKEIHAVLVKAAF